MFEFLADLNNYEERMVGRIEPEDNGGVIEPIDTNQSL